MDADVYHEICTAGSPFRAAHRSSNTSTSMCRQAAFGQSPLQFIRSLGAFMAPIPVLISQIRSPNHRGSMFNNHCSLIVSDLYLHLLSPEGVFFSLWEDQCFSLNWLFLSAFIVQGCTLCSSCCFGGLRDLHSVHP